MNSSPKARFRRRFALSRLLPEPLADVAAAPQPQLGFASRGHRFDRDRARRIEAARSDSPAGALCHASLSSYEIRRPDADQADNF